MEMALEKLSEANEMMKPEESVSSWLAVAARTDKLNERSILLWYVWDAGLRNCPMTDVQKAAWKILLEDKRKIFSDNAEAAGKDMKIPTVGQVAANAWQLAHGNKYITHNNIQSYTEVLGQGVIWDIIYTHTMEEFNGTPKTLWPDEDPLSAQELETLTRKLNALAPAEVAKAVNALSPREKIALFGIAEPIESCRKASRLVQDINLAEDQKESFGFLQDWKGKELTDTMVKQLLEASQKPAKNSYAIHVKTNPFVCGINIQSTSIANTNPFETKLKNPLVIAKFQAADTLKSDEPPDTLFRFFASKEDLEPIRAKMMNDEIFDVKKFDESLAKILKPGTGKPLVLECTIQHQIPGKH